MASLAPLARRRRDALIADGPRDGRQLCTALAEATDDVIVALFDAAVADRAHRRRRGAVALLAVGGYGRRELAPRSDIDVVLVHERRATGVDELAGALWYPLWDAGLKLGHAVRSVDDQLALASDDLDTATSMLSARRLGGDDELAARVITESLARWRKRGRRWLEALRARVAERRDEAGDVAYLLEPDIKDGHGGLRDVQTLWWAADADLLVPADDLEALRACYDRLLDVRVALHRATRRAGDVLWLEDQDAVAEHAGLPSADALMAEVSAAARRIVWIADGVWRHVSRHQLGREEQLAPGVILSEQFVELADDADPATEPVLALRVAHLAAARQLTIGRATLDRLARELDADDWAAAWPAGALEALVALLGEGPAAIDVLESLDQRGILVKMLPEWEVVRSRPQRNAYHRFTVDRHLWEAAANAAGLLDRVRRPDLLLLGALFHDLGKGRAEDHTVVGMALAADIGPRLGLSPQDTATLVTLVEHHLLLPDVAVRRDLADPATIRFVADAVGDVDTLRLLHALTEADSKATGPSAWGTWKEQLVSELVARTAELLATGDATPAGARRIYPDDQTLAAMALGQTSVRIDADEHVDGDTVQIDVICPDQPGTFARVAGVLSLRGIDVLTAWAFSGEVGGPPMAASRLRVTPPHAGMDWEPVVADLRRGLLGQLAIEARLADKARTYRRRRATRAEPAGPPGVWFHDDASDDATVIEVRAPNRLGALHRIAKALSDLGLDIRHATVQSLGEDVVDTFYVRTTTGSRVLDELHRKEIERAVLHAVS